MPSGPASRQRPPPVTALTTAGNATTATRPATLPLRSNNDRPSVITVEVLGYGGGSDDMPDKSDADEKRRRRLRDQHNWQIFLIFLPESLRVSPPQTVLIS